MRTAKWIVAVLSVVAVSVALLTAGKVFAGGDNDINCKYAHSTCGGCGSGEAALACDHCIDCCENGGDASAVGSCIIGQCLGANSCGHGTPTSPIGEQLKTPDGLGCGTGLTQSTAAERCNACEDCCHTYNAAHGTRETGNCIIMACEVSGVCR
jgi:hypothetical protein